MKKIYVLLLFIGMLSLVNSASDTYTLRIIIPSDSPTFTNLQNHQHYGNSTFTYDLDATDDDGIDCFVLNDTSVFNINCSGWIENVTNLDTVNIYWLNVTVNDTLNNLGSDVFFINVTDEFGFVITGLNPDDMILGYNVEFIGRDGLQITIGYNTEYNENYNSKSRVGYNYGN